MYLFHFVLFKVAITKLKFNIQTLAWVCIPWTSTTFQHMQNGKREGPDSRLESGLGYGCWSWPCTRVAMWPWTYRLPPVRWWRWPGCPLGFLQINVPTVYVSLETRRSRVETNNRLLCRNRVFIYLWAILSAGRGLESHRKWASLSVDRCVTWARSL